jgi:hypothetical protein
LAFPQHGSGREVHPTPAIVYAGNDSAVTISPTVTPTVLFNCIKIVDLHKDRALYLN